MTERTDLALLESAAFALRQRSCVRDCETVQGAVQEILALRSVVDELRALSLHRIDFTWLRRATDAIRLELPGPVGDDYCPEMIAIIKVLADVADLVEENR